MVAVVRGSAVAITEVASAGSCGASGGATCRDALIALVSYLMILEDTMPF